MSKLLCTINVPMTDLEYQRNLNIEVAKLELYDTHIIKFNKFTADEVEENEVEDIPENAWVWKEGVRNYIHTTFVRSELIGTEISRLTKCFALYIFLLSGRRLCIYTTKLQLLHSINETLTNYIIGNDEKVVQNFKDILRTE